MTTILLFCGYNVSCHDKIAMGMERDCVKMGEKQDFAYVKVDNKTILHLNKNQSQKRALGIYIYLSYEAKHLRASQTDVSKLIELLDMKLNTSSKKSIQSALRILREQDLVELYTSKRLDECADIEDIIKEPKKTIWCRPRLSVSDFNYTLIPIPYIEEIIFSDTNHNTEELILTLAYVCAKTERRPNVAPVMWCGANNVGSEIHVSGKKFVELSKELKEMGIIQFKLADLGSGRKNYIYGMDCDKEHVDNAVQIAEQNRSLDKRIKYKLDTGDTNGVIERLGDSDYASDIQLSKFFDMHDIEVNDGVMTETNRFYHKHGRGNLLKLLGEYNSEILSADNRIGAYRTILRRSY